MLSHLLMGFSMSLFSGALSPLSYIFPYTTCHVDKFLDDKIITTQDGGIQKYLICWT